MSDELSDKFTGVKSIKEKPEVTSSSDVPKLDDIINELNGVTVFSHLDMNHVYHKLELEEKSHDITTLATHVGLYRNKRANFGTRSKLTSVWPHWSKSM